MELFSMDAFWGIYFFIAGIIVLEKARSYDQKNHYKMRELRRLEWYGRRESDSRATHKLNISGILMTYTGSALSIFGIFKFLTTVL